MSIRSIQMVADELRALAGAGKPMGASLHRLARQLDSGVADLEAERQERAQADAEYLTWSLGGGMAEAVFAGMRLRDDADDTTAIREEGSK